MPSTYRHTNTCIAFGINGSIRMSFRPGLTYGVRSIISGRSMNPPAYLPFTVIRAAVSGPTPLMASRRFRTAADSPTRQGRDDKSPRSALETEFVRRLAALALAAVSTSLLGASGPAAETCPAVDPPAVAAPRVRVFIDPTTGKLRAPTPEELRALAEERRKARARSPRIFDVVVYPDGTRYVNLQDAFAFDVVVEVQPDGSAPSRCVPQKPAAPEK